MSDLPAEIKVWFSRYPIDYMGTWATTRYPAEAVTYVPKADAEAAVALALEEAAEVVKALWKWDDEGWQVERPSQPQAEAALRALAPPAGVAKLAELRAERDEAVSTLAYCEKQWTDTDRITHAKMLDERARADTLAAELAASRAREAGLREASALLRGHAGAAASLLRKFGISESVAEFLEAAVAEHDAALAQPSTEGGE